MSLLDSTEAGTFEIKGTSNLKSLTPTQDAMMINSRSVDTEQKECSWTNEQLSFINTMTTTVLPV